MVQPIHVGYIRWSSDLQEDGDSERRQRQSIVNDTAILGVKVTRWLLDAGVSASTGENTTKGELGGFLGEVRAGSVPPGSVLYLDETTRLTRLRMTKAIRIVADLEDAGVAIRLCGRHQTLTGENLGEMLGFLVESAAGHAFTKELARKIREAWGAKRVRVREAPGKEVLSTITPYGIRAAGGEYVIGKGWTGRHYEPHPEEAPIVKLMFEMARDGHSPRSIVRYLNEQGVQSPAASRGRKLRGAPPRWRVETVRKMLNNRVYLDGSYQPQRRAAKNSKHPDGEAICGHFPVLLLPELWDEAQAEIAARKKSGKGQHSAGVSNLFTGILKCASCGGAIGLRSGGGGARITTCYCTGARDGACTANGYIHRWKLESAILAKISSALVPATILADLNRAHAVIDREAALTRLRAEEKRNRRDVEQLVDRVLALADSANADLFEERLTKARRELADLQDRLARLEEEANLASAATSQRVRAATDFRALFHMAVFGEPRAEFVGLVTELAAALKDAERLRTELGNQIAPARVKLKAAIRRLVSSIVLDVDVKTFVITLQTGQELRGHIDDPIHLDGPDDVILTAYGAL